MWVRDFPVSESGSWGKSLEGRGREPRCQVTGGKKARGREVLVPSARVAGVEAPSEMTWHCRLYLGEATVR